MVVHSLKQLYFQNKIGLFVFLFYLGIFLLSILNIDLELWLWTWSKVLLFFFIWDGSGMLVGFCKSNTSPLILCTLMMFWLLFRFWGLCLGFGVLITFSALLVLTLNKTTIILSSVGLLLATTYPLAKRLWYLPQFHLGLAFSWGIPMAFSAVTGEVPIVAWSLYLTPIIWTMSYDTFYAMVDQHDDLDAGIKSLALLFGREQSKIITLLQIIFLI